MATVRVGCKMPNGVHLAIFAPRPADLPESMPWRPEELARVTVKGTATHQGIPALLIGGYAFTEVDADHWNAWLEANRTSPLLREKLLFAAPANRAEGQAREQESVKPMFPRLDPSKLETSPFKEERAA